ncbi:chemotaxis response regulator protein-glutamate methylesterase [Peribacillus saganii]|uniref:Protein-glutamate methylesterase/protein-glutamine glutaminase n=1 Tax=Peribacillus saganii TaxID=2303992 RepID=A0A372LTB9_9BACI|nr:chemotaxis response regulator protein-glutamate methylesterase [Peribacillus saganii]RFU71306.1 chemotaxis response regulator protein-glutamate methylesterase [Peribacillus saganii]
MKKIRVLVVEDSAFMRKLITEFLSESSQIEVIGTARNGQEAIKKVKNESPDVITMDIEMPLMTGIEALKIIMNENPTPIIMLSSLTSEGAENTTLAMQYGAFDFIAKPSGSISFDLHKVKDELIEKVVAASRVNVERLQNKTNNTESALSDLSSYSTIGSLNKRIITKIPAKKGDSGKKIICIGTSTGGPRALQQVLTALPSDIGAPILVVQHMPAGFTKSLASRLDSLSEIRVKEAEAGEIIQNGTAYIAPGGFHLKVKKVGMSLAVDIDQSEIRNGHRPSVDVMFESISNLSDYMKIAVIMTGMGADGSKGLVELKRKGLVKAIAESQETSIVFGMPKAAISTTMVDSVENVQDIAAAIVKYC